MKRLRKNLSVFCILALMLSFFGGNLIVHAEPDGGHSDTDSTPVITDVVDGENAKVFTCGITHYNFETGLVDKLGTTTEDNLKFVLKTKEAKYLVLVADTEAVAHGCTDAKVLEQCSSTALADAVAQTEVVNKNFHFPNQDLSDITQILVFNASSNKCICNVTPSELNSITTFNYIASSEPTISVGDWVQSDNGYICNLTLNYNLGSFNDEQDEITLLAVDGNAIDIGTDSLSGSGTFNFTLDDTNEGSISYSIITKFSSMCSKQYIGTITLPVLPESDENTNNDLPEAPTITFSKIPESVAYGETFKLTVSSDQPVILQFDSALLSKSEKDYIKEAEVEISRNGIYPYIAKNQNGVVTSGTLEVTCFEDDVTDNDTDDSYWNGVDDSSKKLAQTGLYNNPLFYIISFMLVAGIALIVYVLKFRKRGARNE